MDKDCKIRIGNVVAGKDMPVFVIAEIGINHNGDLDLAHRLIDVAADAGASGVKFQTVDPDSSYIPGTPAHGAFYGKTFHLEQYKELIDHCSARRQPFITTPGDLKSLALCRQLNLSAVKISSGLMTNIPLIRAAAKLGIPMIISTGMSYLWEVARIVHEVEKIGNREIALLHCVSQYPAPDHSLALRAIEVLKNAFPYPIGYSDHSDGAIACLCAVSLGATIIEKHLTMNRHLPGPDHHSSLEPGEFIELVRQIRSCERMLTRYRKEPYEGEISGRATNRRCIVANTLIRKGQIITEEHVGLKRPNGEPGLDPEFYSEVLGKRACRDIQPHEALHWNAIIPEVTECPREEK